MNILKIEKVDEKAKLPFKKYETDSGWDLTVNKVIKKSLFKIHYGLGIKVDFQPKTLFGRINPRSSIHKRYLFLSNSEGIIDNSYKGELQVVFYKIPFLSKPYRVGERCCQLILDYRKDQKIIFKEGDIGISERGEGGFGSTGK